MGKKVRSFESQFKDYVGQKGALMVNSGSSANLLALSALSSPNFNNRIKPGDEVICPAVTWPTSVYPILNVGAKPVFIDSNAKTWNIETKNIASRISRKTKAIGFICKCCCRTTPSYRLCKCFSIHTTRSRKLFSFSIVDI